MERKKIVILGAGISGHTAALFAKRYLKDKAEVTVISPNKSYNWIPSNIWVGVNQMSAEDVVVSLQPVYQNQGISFIQGKGVEICPEGDKSSPSPYVVYESTAQESLGKREQAKYDYLVNATGPKLNFEATPGLGPDNYTFSVCTVDHAILTGKKLHECIEEMKKGKNLTLVVGVGHGTCTCEGAAFEYVFNVDAELRTNGVRKNARLIFLTNEPALGDFGVDGIQFNIGGYVTPSSMISESLFSEKEIEWILGAHVKNINASSIEYETLSGAAEVLEYNFAMLLPPFKGNLLKSFSRDGVDITDKLFTSNHFMKVDADYTVKTYQDWRPGDWPSNYQNPTYANIYAIGIAFAPPHQISMPRKNPNGTLITPAPPRTGMPSAIMGKAIARNIADLILENHHEPQSASMAELSAACVASVATGFLNGSAVAMTMSPIVPDFTKFPDTGRDLYSTFAEVGLAGHWIKRLLHTMFMYKAKAKKFWWMIPE